MSKQHKEQLGREILIPSEASVSFNPPGYKVAYHIKTVNVSIGIGKDYCADLIMSEEAWEALKSGSEVNINLVEKPITILHNPNVSKETMDKAKQAVQSIIEKKRLNKI